MKKSVFAIFIFFAFFSLSADFYRTNATVSYYAEAFHGKKTSSGEIFNMYDLTCAHKILPFGTKVKVTNLENGKSVVVRVNDRGPFVKSREMDLSKAAAARLGMIKSGTAKASLEIVSLGKNTKLSEQTAQKACKIAGISYNADFSNSIKSGKGAVAESSKDEIDRAAATGAKSFLYDIQIGAFSSKSNANNLAQKLLKDGFSDVVFQTQKNDASVVRVVIRKVSSENLEKIEKSLKSKGYSGYVVKKRVV